MGRPKGVKNRAKEITIEERINVLETEIAAAETSLKAKKEELKSIKKKQEEYHKKELLDAITTSGKTKEEILAFLAGTEK